MAATRRLTKELEDLRRQNHKHFKDITVDEQNILEWNGLLLPKGDAFGEGAFRVKLEFPAEYPFKPPKITFQTKIYHPNIDEKGQVCLPIISTENWKPATKTDQVIESLIKLVQEPEPEHPLRADIAEEFNRDQKMFIRKAKEYTKKHSEKRPAA